MNIFIAGLNYNMSEAELGELFAEYGEVVSVKIIMDRETGRSKGYGFVEMADDEAGDKAIAALNEVDMDGKTLSVSIARPREERPRRSYGNNGGGYRGGNNSRGGWLRWWSRRQWLWRWQKQILICISIKYKETCFGHLKC